MERHQVHSDQPLPWAERGPADHTLGHSCHTAPGLGILLCETKTRRSRGRQQEPCEGPRMRYNERPGSGAQTLQDHLQPLRETGSRALCLCIPASAHLLQTTRKPHPAHLCTHWETPLLAPLLWPSSPGGGRGAGGQLLTSPTTETSEGRAETREGQNHVPPILQSNPNTTSESLTQLHFLSGEAGPDHQISTHTALD